MNFERGLMRFLLNLSDYLYTNFDIKKISGIFGIFGSFVYLYISGIHIAATRAFIMTSMFIFSVVINRSVFPIRSICISALMMLLFNPEDLYHPSFQLSFVAVLSLISGFELLKLTNFLDFHNKNFVFHQFL